VGVFLGVLFFVGFYIFFFYFFFVIFFFWVLFVFGLLLFFLFFLSFFFSGVLPLLCLFPFLGFCGVLSMGCCLLGFFGFRWFFFLAGLLLCGGWGCFWGFFF